MASEEYDIKDSIPRVGHLYPVLKDAYGNVIDGLHRLRQDPSWPVKKLDNITDPLQLAIARLVANVCRRDVAAEEKTEWLRQIATMTGWSPKDIADHLPVSYSWVIKYLPEEFKDKEKKTAASKGGEARAEAYRESQDFGTRRMPESEDMRFTIDKTVECECCSLSTFFPQDFEGHQVCRRCFRELTEGKRTLPKKGPEKVTEKVRKKVTTPPKVKEPWPDRMHARISNMHQAIIERLQAEGIRFETEKEFCVQSTIADIYLPDYDLPIYLDGEDVHKDREERDMQLRELLAKRYHKDVLSLSYKSNTKTQQDTVFNQIMEMIGGA